MALMNVCAVRPCGCCVLIVGWVVGFRWTSGGQSAPGLELVSLRHRVVHMWAWSGPSLPVQLPAHCGAVMKTLGFRSHTP